MTTACNDLSGLAGNQQLPSGIADPSVYHTATGALALYQATLAAFQFENGDEGNTSLGSNAVPPSNGAFVDYVLAAGLISDELQAGDLGAPPSVSFSTVPLVNVLDARQLIEGEPIYITDPLYSEVQALRNDAIEGIGALAAYDASASPALRGQLYALQGYADLFLSELYCSGVPLSTIDFTGDATPHAGSTTAQVDTQAVFKFDTALALSGDSTRVLNLARVGKGRAWLDLGAYDSAAAAVAAVPDDFAYQFLVDWNGGQAGTALFTGYQISNINDGGITVAEIKGINGLPYLSNGDPRDSSEVLTVNQYGVPQYAPLKYGGAAPAIIPITVADWIEARLITAEAALYNPAKWGNWLDILNTLRATAITPALPQLNDPGTPAARALLLFQERAYWLFLTGHRQGDLRRLIRQYHLDPTQVYPTGSYPLAQIGPYGSFVTAPIPTAEQANPLFRGCLSRGA